MATHVFSKFWKLVQLGTYNCTVIVGFNAQLLEYFAVLHLLSVWNDGQNILVQLVSYLGREILACWCFIQRQAGQVGHRRAPI